MGRSSDGYSLRLADFTRRQKALGWEVFEAILNPRDARKPFEVVRTAMADQRPISLDGFTYLNHEGLIWLLLLAEYCREQFGHPLIIQRPLSTQHRKYIENLKLREASLGPGDNGQPREAAVQFEGEPHPLKESLPPSSAIMRPQNL